MWCFVFSCYFQDSLFIFGFYQFDYSMPWGNARCVYPTWDSLQFLDSKLKKNVSPNLPLFQPLKKIFPLTPFFFSPSEAPLTHLLKQYCSTNLSHSLHFERLFSLCPLDWLISIHLSSISTIFFLLSSQIWGLVNLVKFLYYCTF